MPDLSPTARQLIHALDLRPHPEGGYYRETYRSEERVTCQDGRTREACTAIHYMLCANDYSAWHRIRSDELWHYHAGSPLDVHRIVDGTIVTQRLGDPLRHPGAAFQALVPGGQWFAAERVDAGGPEDFTLVGCTVAPAFQFSEFELASAATLAGLVRGHDLRWQRLLR
ncbi:cupin domain-containing protein [Cupriavidus nantongensis]|uniref:cupin domain-containing protein n=1 Tax=Cupriavidus nantongensis TaxID=1796606 RepID=UPI002245B3C8|nr:cupin domain-containing protein [Cupriavidus nantongensis]